jgi:hypothetical protein
VPDERAELALEVDCTLKSKVAYMYPLDIHEARLLLEHTSAGEVRKVEIVNNPIW